MRLNPKKAVRLNRKRNTPPSHALFWTLLKEVPGYDPHYKDVIKEGIVHEHSGGRTTSLSEMYTKYPKEYSLMIEAMKGNQEQKKPATKAVPTLPANG